MLDEYLSRALNVGLEKGRLTVIDDSAYVLTLDYTLKMLNIHERYMCGVPVIIEGETGVGKTALVEMLSKLWNQSLLLEWKIQRSRLLDFFRNEISNAPGDSKPGDYEVSQETLMPLLHSIVRSRVFLLVVANCCCYISMLCLVDLIRDKKNFRTCT